MVLLALEDDRRRGTFSPFSMRCPTIKAQVEYSVQPLTTVHLRRGHAPLPRVRV